MSGRSSLNRERYGGGKTNMDEQDRQDGVHVSFRSTIVREFFANLLVEERSLTRTK
jgi:hypothetical protein